MRTLFVLFLFCSMAWSAFAIPVTPIVKGVAKVVSKFGDDAAKQALRASGREVTDDAVKATAKILQEVEAKYGDDVAKAAVRGGVEVAEQSLKHGAKFASLIRRAGTVSDDALRAVAKNSDDVMKYAAKYGDDVATKLAGKAPGVFERGIVLVEKAGTKNTGKTLAVLAEKIPAEKLPQVYGAIEHNPKVAKEFLDGVTRGGEKFVDKIFKLNGKQILTGTLGAAAIAGVVRMTAPDAAEARAIDAQTKTATTLLESDKPLAGHQAQILKDWSNTNSKTRTAGASSKFSISMILAVFAGVAMLIYVVRHTSAKKVDTVDPMQQTARSTHGTDTTPANKIAESKDPEDKHFS